METAQRLATLGGFAYLGDVPKEKPGSEPGFSEEGCLFSSYLWNHRNDLSTCPCAVEVLLAAVCKLDDAFDEGEDGVILSHIDVLTSKDNATALSHDD